MSTGSLKLASLLVVIAAGGGVAWQAQQGILHPQAESTETAPDDAEFRADVDADVETNDSGPDLLTASAPTELSSNRWKDDEQSPTPLEKQLPSKFQRANANSSQKSKSVAVPIPARTSPQRTPRPLNEETEPEPTPAANDSFGDQSSPELADFDSEPDLNPQPESDPLPALSSADTFSEESLPENSAMQVDVKTDTADTAANDSADPFSNDSPVLLVAGSDDEAPPRRRTPPKLDLPTEVTDEPFPADDGEMDDPFSGAAPPEFGDEPAAEPAIKSPKSRDLPEESSNDADFGADLFSTDEPTPAEEPAPAPRRRPPVLEPADDSLLPAESMPDDSSAVEPLPDLGSPGSLPAGKSRLKSPAAEEPTEAIPPRSRATSPRSPVDDAPRVNAPRLLPDPSEPTGNDPMDVDGASFGDDPNADLFPAEEPAPRKNSDTKSSTPLPDVITPEELRGDATPDRAAPTGMQQPRLTIEKVAPKQAILGQPLIYSVIVKNAGSADAHHVTVEDRIPKGTKLEGTSPRAEMVDKTLTWKLGTLKPNEEKKISIKVIPQEQGPIGSVAKVNFVAEITAEIEVTAPQVLVTIDAPSQVRLGEKLRLTFKIRNAGRAPADNVVLRNLIPDGLRHAAGADLEYAIGTLPPEESRDITLDLVATKNGKVTNKTIITGDHGIEVEDETPIEVIGEQLLLTRTGKNKLYIDRAANFTSTVANEGTAAATRVMVAEIVPVGFEFVSASDQGKYDPSTRAVTWSVGPIGAGEELKLSTKLMPKNLGDYRATVTVTGPAGSVATVESELKIDGFPAMAVESKSDSRLIAVGEKATIRIHLKNQGTAAAKNTILTASLPPELKLTDSKGPAAWAQQGNVVTFEAVPGIAPDETSTFELQVEGIAEGDTRIELQISADHLKRPLHRDETIRVAPEEE